MAKAEKEKTQQVRVYSTKDGAQYIDFADLLLSDDLERDIDMIERIFEDRNLEESEGSHHQAVEQLAVG